MAKKIGTLLLIFVGCYLGAHYWMRWQLRHGAQSASPQRLADCDPNHVRQIRLERKDGQRFELARTDELRPGIPPSASLQFSEWSLAGDPAREADSSLAVRLASIFCDLYDPTPDATAGQLTTAGAASSLELVMDGPGAPTYHLDFGPYTRDRLNLVHYRGPNGEDRNVRISPKLLQVASVNPAELPNLKVLRMTGDLVQTLSLHKEGNERFSLEREGAGWMVRSHGKEIGPGSARADQYVNRLGTLRALSSAPRGDESCESQASQLVLKIQGVGDREEDLYLSYGTTGNVHVCNTAREETFEVHRDLLQYVDVSGPYLTN